MNYFQEFLGGPSFTRKSGEIINDRFEYVWSVVEKDFLAVYSVVDVGLIRWNENSKRNPVTWRGELYTSCIQSCLATGKDFSSPSELEAAFDDIFEYFYRKKSS